MWLERDWERKMAINEEAHLFWYFPNPNRKGSHLKRNGGTTRSTPITCTFEKYTEETFVAGDAEQDKKLNK